MTAEKLKNLLNARGNGDLGDIILRARHFGELTETLSKSLGEEFSGSIVAASLRDGGELVVVARSPAWAAKLRFEAEKLAAAARDAGETVQRCTVRVSHEPPPA